MSFSVVILSKNAENLVPCAWAVRDREMARIIVVDDGARAEAEPHMPPHGIEWVTGVKPFIFARNANLGIMAAGTDDVVLLNDDALLRPGNEAFSGLAKVAEEHPEFGVIASTCNNVGNQNQFPRARGLREDPRMVCFVCVYIPRSTINTVGLLDERFVGYGMDDDDYCLRVRNAGLKIGIYDGCFVDHSILNSEFRGHGAGDFRPNLKRFIEKHGVDNWGRPREHSEFASLFR